MLDCALISQNDLNKVPATLVTQAGLSSIFVDDEGNEFCTYRITIGAYIVL